MYQGYLCGLHAGNGKTVHKNYGEETWLVVATPLKNLLVNKNHHPISIGSKQRPEYQGGLEYFHCRIMQNYSYLITPILKPRLRSAQHSHESHESPHYHHDIPKQYPIYILIFPYVQMIFPLIFPYFPLIFYIISPWYSWKLSGSISMKKKVKHGKIMEKHLISPYIPIFSIDFLSQFSHVFPWKKKCRRRVA